MGERIGGRLDGDRRAGRSRVRRWRRRRVHPALAEQEHPGRTARGHTAARRGSTGARETCPSAAHGVVGFCGSMGTPFVVRSHRGLRPSGSRGWIETIETTTRGPSPTHKPTKYGIGDDCVVPWSLYIGPTGPSSSVASGDTVVGDRTRGSLIYARGPGRRDVVRFARIVSFSFLHAFVHATSGSFP